MRHTIIRRVAIIASIGMLAIGLWSTPSGSAQELDGRVTERVRFTPPSSAAIMELMPLQISLLTQLDIGLRFPELSTSSTLQLDNLGLSLAWVQWQIDFPKVTTSTPPPSRQITQSDRVKLFHALPETVRPGSAFDATVIVEALQDLTGQAVDVVVTLPDRWRISPVEPIGSRISAGSARWAPDLGTPGSRALIRYQGRVPFDAPEAEFSVEIRVDVNGISTLEMEVPVRVRGGPAPVPGRVQFSQNFIMANRVSNGQLAEPIGFRISTSRLRLGIASNLTLSNFLRVDNVGSTQTPSLRWSDVVLLQGRTSSGVRVQSSARFDDQGSARFAGGTLQISDVPLSPQLTVDAQASYDETQALDLRLQALQSTEFLGVPVRLTAEVGWDPDRRFRVLNAGLSFASEPNGRVTFAQRHGRLAFDGVDDDGVAESRLAITSRQVQFQLTLGKLDLRSISTFAPTLGDVDSDGADERITVARLTRQEIRLTRTLQDFIGQGRLLFTADSANVVTLAFVQTRMTLRLAPWRFSVGTSLNLDTTEFQGEIESSFRF